MSRNSNSGTFALIARAPSGTDSWVVQSEEPSRLQNSGLQFRTKLFNLFNHPQYGIGSFSLCLPAGSGPSAMVFTSPADRFLPTQFGDGSGRLIRYLLKLTF